MGYLYLLTFLAIANALYDEDSAVKMLDSSNFDKLVGNAGQLALVEFYAPWCGHCKQLAPEYVKAAELLKGFVDVYAIDASDESNAGIARSQQIQGFPTIKLFNGLKVIPYASGASAKEIADFAMKYVNNVKTLTSKNYKKWLKKKDLVRVMLFTKKADAGEFYNILSKKFDGHALFGMVRKDKKIAKKFKVSYSDKNTILVFEKGSKEPIWYMGGMRKLPFKKFLMKYIPEVKPDKDDFLPKVLDESCWQATCKKKGLCVVMISNHDEEESERVHDSVMEAQEETDSASLFGWVQIDGVVHREWCTAVFGGGMNWDLPQVVVISTVKNMYAQYFGSYSHHTISSFVSGILTGSTRTAKISAEEIPQLPTDTTHCKVPEKKKKKKKSKGKSGTGPGYGSDLLVTLTSENFQQEILDSPKPAIVEFYAPWCGHCKNLAPHYAKAATKLNGMVTFGVVDCTTQEELCGEYSIEGFPTLKTFEMEADTPADYQGPREAKGIAKYAKNLLNKAKVSRLKDSNVDKLKSSGTKIILFSDKAKIPTLLKGLAAKFTSYKFYISDASNDAIMEHFKVTEDDMPKFYMQTPEDESKYYVYNGDNDYRMIAAWIDAVSTGGGVAPEDDKETKHDEL